MGLDSFVDEITGEDEKDDTESDTESSNSETVADKVEHRIVHHAERNDSRFDIDEDGNIKADPHDWAILYAILATERFPEEWDSLTNSNE